MDKEQLKRLANDPRLIAGIYNYCDRWCERCEFTSRCMNYALSREEFPDEQSRDINNKQFWDKMHGIFQSTIAMAKEIAQEMGVDLEAADPAELAKQQELVHKTAEQQPYARAAHAYTRMVNEWFDSNKHLIENKANEIEMLTGADVPGADPQADASVIGDCLEVIRYYQHFIYVKLLRAATGMIRGDLDDAEYFPQDANGSAKVAVIAVERSIAAWGQIMQNFPEQEDDILDILVALQRLLRQVEAAFPDARAYVRPGLDEPPG